jgi:hypothetical protein
MTQITQLEIDCYEWVLGKIDVNKIPFERLERIIKATIKDLKKREDKATLRTDTDNLWTKIESLQWVLFVIFAIRNGKMVVIIQRIRKNLLRKHPNLKTFVKSL